MKDIFVRSQFNPILQPNPTRPWESRKVYNPGAVFHEGEYHLFYRAVGDGADWNSALGYAVSADGEHFERYPDPILVRNENDPFEVRGLEDPRITKVGDQFFMLYAVYNGKTPRLSLAISKDLKRWKKYGPILSSFQFFDEGGVRVKWKDGKPVEYLQSELLEKSFRTKAGGMFPEKIGGKYWMLFNEFRIWLANSDDGIHWGWLPGPFLSPRKGTDFFDNIFVEMGPPPIKTEKGWLVFYHGVNDTIQYQLGILVLDLNDPRKILFRSEEPIFSPYETYELSGLVDIIPNMTNLLATGKEEELKTLLREAEAKGFMPQVVFVPAAVVVHDTLRIFYGAGDQCVCTATASMVDILSLIP